MTATTMGIKLDEDIRARLKILGKHQDRTTHWLMKKAISEFLEREEALEIRNRQADESFNEYLTTSQSVNYEEMDSWLKTWGTDKETACPSLEN